MAQRVKVSHEQNPLDLKLHLYILFMFSLRCASNIIKLKVINFNRVSARHWTDEPATAIKRSCNSYNYQSA